MAACEAASKRALDEAGRPLQAAATAEERWPKERAEEEEEEGAAICSLRKSW